MPTPPRFRTLLACLLIAPALALPCRAGVGPENVAVVVNADSWASLAVANEFIRLRAVPPQNVIYLHDLPGPDPVDVDTFRERILLPVFKVLEARHVAAQIDCVAWSADLPYAVDVQKDAGKTPLPQVITPVASINGLTYLYPLVLTKNINYLGLNINFYCRKPVRPAQDGPWSDADRKLNDKAVELLKAKKADDAAGPLAQLVASHPRSPLALYNDACCEALRNKPEEAMALLRRAFDAGWLDSNAARDDDDLKALHDRPDFKALVAEMGRAVFGTQPAHGFRAAYDWSPAGNIVARQPNVPAMRYLLSTMLAVTSGRGNSVSEALDSLRRAASADSTFPKGTIYYMNNGDVRSTTRKWGFASAVEALKKLGVKGEVVDGILPQNKSDVAGAMVGIADFDWKASGCRALPGAIMEHLTSTGAVMVEDAGQTPISAFVRAGAAGTSGTVTEPYALQQKFPTPFMHVFYAQGCSLAEAFYQAVEGPYQLLIIGDPMCAPWAKRPAVRVDGIKAGETVKGSVTIRPAAAEGNAVPVGHFELFLDGLRVALTTKPDESFPLDTTKLIDGTHELRAVAVAADPIETQGRTAFHFTVDNRGGTVTCTAARADLPWDESFQIDVRHKGAKSILLVSNGREIGRADGEGGVIAVAARKLGQGEVTVQALATEADNTRAVSRPLTLHVLAPPLLPAQKIESAKLAGGLLVTPAGGPPAVADTTRPGDWLAKAGVKAAQAFTAEAYFDAATDDNYQFQIRSPLTLTLEVDGKAIWSPDDKEAAQPWTYAPVALSAGTHHLKLASGGGKETHLEIRFGGPGARVVEGNHFKHLPPK